MVGRQQQTKTKLPSAGLLEPGLGWGCTCNLGAQPKSPQRLTVIKRLESSQLPLGLWREAGVRDRAKDAAQGPEVDADIMAGVSTTRQNAPHFLIGVF